MALKTKEFQDCVAWFNKPDIEGETANIRSQRLRLNENDLQAIKRTILEGAFPQELKEKLKQTT